VCGTRATTRPSSRPVAPTHAERGVRSPASTDRSCSRAIVVTGSSRPPPSGCVRTIQNDPDVAAVPVCAHERQGRDARGRPEGPRRRTRAPPSSCTACATTPFPPRLGAPGSTCTSAGRPPSRRPLRHARPAAALHVRRDPADELHLADARVPVAARAAQGRGHEPAFDRRGLRP
jgi:hypothetical protein